MAFGRWDGNNLQIAQRCGLIQIAAEQRFGSLDHSITAMGPLAERPFLMGIEIDLT